MLLIGASPVIQDYRAVRSGQHACSLRSSKLGTKVPPTATSRTPSMPTASIAGHSSGFAVKMKKVIKDGLYDIILQVLRNGSAIDAALKPGQEVR